MYVSFKYNFLQTKLTMKYTKILFIILSFFNLSVYCEEPETLPKEGLIASSNFTSTSDSIDGPWGGINITDDDRSPVSGSVKKISNTEYEYTIVNNSDSQYSSSIGLVQFDKNKKIIKTTNTNVNLKPGEKVSRTFRAAPLTNNVSIKLNKWKKKSKSKSPEEIKAEIAEKKQEIKELEQELLQ
mgnify:CR=1 FL=1